jgi:hypothetical protein
MNETKIAPETKIDATSPPAAGSGGAGPAALDLNQFRLDQNFGGQTAVKRQLLTVPVRKPSKHEFVRVHPDAQYRMIMPLLSIKEDNETYLVVPGLRPALAGYVVSAKLYTTINRQEVLALWSVPVANEDGTINPWHQSAHEAASQAVQQWTKIIANKSLGAYDIYTAEGDLPDPTWPDVSFQQIVTLAFKGKVIDNLEHPIVRKLRGEI